MPRRMPRSRHPIWPISPIERSPTARRWRDELGRVREQGWSLVDGELEPGLRSIAAPLHGRDGRVVGALNVSTSATRDSVEHVRDAYLPPLLRTAAAIDAELRLV